MEHEPGASNVLYTGQVFRATARAMERAASTAHEHLKRGLNTLATVASIAKFVGMLGTLWAIGFDTFFGLGTNRPVIGLKPGSGYPSLHGCTLCGTNPLFSFFWPA